jgi:hypothetical protein
MREPQLADGFCDMKKIQCWRGPQHYTHDRTTVTGAFKDSIVMVIT